MAALSVNLWLMTTLKLGAALVLATLLIGAPPAVRATGKTPTEPARAVTPAASPHANATSISLPGPRRSASHDSAARARPASARRQQERALDWRFDVVTFNCPGQLTDHLCQPQFDELNWVSTNGHFLAMGSDAHRPELDANGNVLAIYYNNLTAGWTMMSGTEKADQIHMNWVLARFTSNGPAPDWIILNEISASQWPSNAAYRAWLIELLQQLNGTYGYNVILASPFPNPGAHDPDWQAVSSYAFIAIEQYLSGQAIRDHAFSVDWAQSQYAGSVHSYLARGVPTSQLFLIEHFGQTLDQLPDGTPVTWGRKLVNFDDWDLAINVRSAAARNVGFAGFVSYAWAKNAMGAPDADLLHFEQTYRGNPLP